MGDMSNNVIDAIYLAKIHLYTLLSTCEHPDCTRWFAALNMSALRVQDTLLTLEHLFTKCKEFGLVDDLCINFSHGGRVMGVSDDD